MFINYVFFSGEIYTVLSKIKSLGSVQMLHFKRQLLYSDEKPQVDFSYILQHLVVDHRSISKMSE